MKNKADREAARKKKRSERLKNRKLKETKNPFIHQFSSGKKEVWIMPGTEMAGRKSDQNKGDVPDRTREAAVDEYYTTFTHSEVWYICVYNAHENSVHLSSLHQSRI